MHRATGAAKLAVRLAATLRLSPWAGGPKYHWVRVPMLQVTGRRLPRAWAGPIPSA